MAIYNSRKDVNLKKNPIFIDGMIAEMNKKFGYCLPMSTNLMGKLVIGNTKKTVSIGPVEAWFKTFSINVLQNERNLRPSRYVRERQTAIQGLLKQLQIFPEKQTKMCSQKRITQTDYNVDSGNPLIENNIEETWNKTKPKKTTYLNYIFLKRNQVLPKDRKNNESKRVKMTNSDTSNKTPQVDTTLKQLVLYSNGTVASPNFYDFIETEKNIVIGSLEHLTDSAFGKTFIMESDLTIVEINVFNDKQWLSTSSIELVSAIIWNNSKLKLDASVLSPNIDNEIFGENNSDPKHVEFYELFPNREISCWIIPFNVRNSHWVLAIVNLKFGFFGFSYPLSYSLADTIKYKTSFNFFTNISVQIYKI